MTALTTIIILGILASLATSTLTIAAAMLASKINQGAIATEAVNVEEGWTRELKLSQAAVGVGRMGSHHR
jgi:hypothetical protein